MDPNVRAAWIAASVAILGTIATVISGFGLQWSSDRAQRKQDIMQERKVALFNALEALDHIYANMNFNNSPPVNAHQWDITKARSAVNGMIVYCENPNEAVNCFYKAARIINSDAESDEPTQCLKYLDDFRRIVCEELELPPTSFSDPNKTWIASAPGGK